MEGGTYGLFGVDPYADPYAETSGWKQWTGPLQRATPFGQNSAKRTQKHRFYFHPNLHTQEVTDSSSVVSTRKRLISHEIRRFCYFFGAKPYGSKSGSAQDPDRDPYAERTQWSGQHGAAFYGFPPIIIREEYYVALETWDAQEELALLREFFRRQTEKMWRRRSHVRRGVSEGVLFVLPSSCSITPPTGEGDSLQQTVSGAQWSRQERSGIPESLLPVFYFWFVHIAWSMTLPMVSAASRFIRWVAWV